jgi:hypothetical protein
MRTAQFTLKHVLEAFARKKVLTKGELLEACRCSPMTAWRILQKHGYFTSYNHNAKYYTLAHIPQFDEQGLWAYGKIRFSKWKTLPQTIVALIEQGPAGMTARELAALLHVPNVKPTLSKLAHQGRLGRERIAGAFVYLAVDQTRRREQTERRRTEGAPKRRSRPLPDPQPIIALLVEMIQHPQQTPRRWARRLARRNIRLGTQDIQAVMDHYQLTVKKGLLSS